MTGSVEERIRAIARSKTPAVSARKWVIIPPMSSLKPNERIIVVVVPMKQHWIETFKRGISAIDGSTKLHLAAI